MVDTPPDRPFARSELADLGITRSQLLTWVRVGAVRGVFRGTYAPNHLPDDLDVRTAAAALILPAHCVVVDRSAALLHGIDLLEHAETAAPPRLEVASTDGAERTRRTGVLGGERDLLASEVVRVRGVPVTDPTRTACDVACLRGRGRALAALDAFRREFGLSIGDLERQARRFRGRRGVIQLRELIRLSTNRAESQPESWTRILIIDAGLPAPSINRSVWVDGWGWVRLDLLYEHLRIAIEFDGEEHHSTEADRAHDVERRAALRRAGWIVIVLRRSDLSAAARGDWLLELRRAIEARQPVAQGKRVYSRAPRDPRYVRRP